MKFVSLLRGINVSGQKKILMADLRALYTKIGFENVQSYIQSGNVVFEADGNDNNEIQRLIKSTIQTSYNFDVKILVKTEKEWAAIYANLPFKDHDISKIHVTLLSSIPSTFPETRLREVKHDLEDFVYHNDAIYLFCPNGYGRTKLNNTTIERNLKVNATTRNWKTVTKIYEMLMG